MITLKRFGFNGGSISSGCQGGFKEIKYILNMVFEKNLKIPFVLFQLVRV